MKLVSEEEAAEFKKSKAKGGRKKTPLRLVIDHLKVGEKLLCTKANDYPDRTYRHVYYTVKHEERVSGKKFAVTPNEIGDKVLIERLG